jgi:hypothetical protein
LADSRSIRWLDLAAWRALGWDRKGSVANLDLVFDPDRLELTMHSQVPLARVPVFKGIDDDLTDRATAAERLPGPLAQLDTAGAHRVDPRSSAHEIE